MKIGFEKKDKSFSLIIVQILFVLFLCIGVGYEKAFEAKAENVSASTNATLCEKSEAECVEFIVEHNVSIPSDFINNSELGKFVKEIIVEVEKNPDVEFFYNYGATQEFAENIKTAVLSRYGDEAVSALSFSPRLSSRYTYVDTLPNNTQYGEWQSNYLDYNCYSYAINYIEGNQDIDRGRYPGQMSNGSFSMSLSISEMAGLVKNDLIAIGYDDVYVTNERPTVLCEGEKLICIRKGTDDYHFMKYHSDGDFWTHKPGGTAILKYNHQPSNDVIWRGEAILDSAGTAVIDQSITYTSEIYYIIYDWAGIYVNNGTITGFDVPTKFDGFLDLPSVESIAPNVFANQTQITSVTIPKTLVSIGEGAFSGCTDLEVVYFENNGDLVEIGARAFENCASLNEMTLPDTLERLRTKAFLNCSSLGIIYISRDMQSIAGDAFDGCDGVVAIVYNAVACGDFSATSQPFTALINAGAEITLTTNVQRLPAYFLKDCSGLTTISLPSTLTLIGVSAFEGCTGISGITIPQSVTTINNRAFYGCTEMCRVTVNATAVYVNTEAFAYSGLISIAFPNVVNRLGSRAFYSCTRLQGVTINIMMGGLGEQTFYGCTSLFHVSIFYTTEEFDPKVFYGASPSDFIWTNANSGYYRSERNHLIRKSDNVLVLGNWLYPIPESVTGIADEAFIGRFSLTTLTIPVNVTSIGSRVFKDCTNLTTLNYSGTIAEWEQIAKATDWNEGSSIATVVCSDGSITL